MKKTTSIYLLALLSFIIIGILLIRHFRIDKNKYLEVPILAEHKIENDPNEEGLPELVQSQIFLQVVPISISKDLTDWFAFLNLKKMLNFAVNCPANERLLFEFSLNLYAEDGIIEELAFVLASDPKLKLNSSFKIGFISGYDDFGLAESYRLRALVGERMIERLDYAAPILSNEKSSVIDVNLLVTRKNIPIVLAYWLEPINGMVLRNEKISLRSGITVEELMQELRKVGFSKTRVLSVKCIASQM